jgi:hypothetical protein
VVCGNVFCVCVSEWCVGVISPYKGLWNVKWLQNESEYSATNIADYSNVWNFIFVPLYTPTDIIHKSKKYNIILKSTAEECDVERHSILQILYYFLHKIIHHGIRTHMYRSTETSALADKC